MYRTLGSGALPVGVVQAVVGTASVAALYAVTAAVLGPAAGLVAAALTAVDVAQLSLTARRLSEGLFTLELLMLVLASLRLRARLREGVRPLGWAVTAGVIAGIGTLTRSIFVGYPLLIAAALVLERKASRRRAAVTALILLASYGVSLLPWMLRNAAALGTAVPVATQGGITLYSSWFPPGGTVFGIFPNDAVTRAAAGLSEPEQSRHFVAATARRLAEEPQRIPRLLVLKMLYLVVPLDWEVLPIYGAVNPTYLVVLGWAVAFLVALGAGRRRAAWPIWLPLAYLAGMALVFYGSPRLRAPLDPLLAALAGGAVVELARRRSRRTATLAIVASCAGAVALVWLAGPLKVIALGALRRVGLWRR